MRIRRSWVPFLAAGAGGLAFAGMIPFLGGPGAPGVALAASTPGSGSATAQYVPEAPDRILDTRKTGQPISGTGYSGSGPLTAGTVYTVDLTKTDVPAAAGALAVNVTAVGPTTVGNLRIGPSCGSGAPPISLVNYEAGKDVANYVVVPLQCSPTTAPVRALTLYSAGAATNVTLDVSGYYPTVGSETTTPTSSGSATVTPTCSLGIGPACLVSGSTSATSTSSSAPATSTSSSGLPTSLPTGTSTSPGTGISTPGFTAVTPYRAADTRDGTGGTSKAPIAAGSSRAFQITGTTVPAGAAAVAINVTSVAQPGAGNLRVFPDGASTPTTSNVNYIPGVDKAGFVIVQLPANGKIDVYAAGSADNVVLDVFGYYPSTSTLVTSAPARILDTRTSGTAQGLPSPLLAATPYTVQVSGKGGVPAGAQAALLSVTSIEPSAGSGNLRVYPGGGTLPDASTINYIGSGFDVANFVIAPLSSSGTITLYSAGSPVNVTVDVLGYVPGTGGTSTSSSSTATSSSSSSSSASTTATATCTPTVLLGVTLSPCPTPTS